MCTLPAVTDVARMPPQANCRLTLPPDARASLKPRNGDAFLTVTQSPFFFHEEPFRAAVPNLYGTRFHGRIFFHGLGRGSGLEMTQAHYIYCALYFCYYISATSDPQALYPGGWGPLKSICLHPTGSSWFSVDMEGLQALGRGLHGAQLSLVTASNQHTAFLKGTAQPLGVFDLRPLKWELLLSLSPLSSCQGLHGDPPQTTVFSHPHPHIHTWTSLASCPKPQN